ncbi:MAG: exodeoxyribonuclease VII large subunit [Stellaceae bacterium]
MKKWFVPWFVPGLLLVLVALPAFADTIAASDARAHVGQTVTVEGTVSNVHTSGRSGTVFLDIGGRYPHNAFTAVIFKRDTAKFHGVAALNGKTVDVTGKVQLYRGRPEIILNGAGQLKTR